VWQHTSAPCLIFPATSLSKVIFCDREFGRWNGAITFYHDKLSVKLWVTVLLQSLFTINIKQISTIKGR
jgi:hypothetical protein